MKKALALILTAAFLTGALTACGSAAQKEAGQTAETTENAEAAADTDGETATGELKVITVAATAVPHAESMPRRMA